MERICLQCGKRYKKRVDISVKQFSKSKYCSSICRYIPKGKFFKCPTCNKDVYRIPFAVKRSKVYYCSFKCQGIARIGKENPYNIDKGHTITYKCEECGKDKKVILAVYNKAKHHFCSFKCANTYKSKTKVKENHWNWKGGITEENHLIRNSVPYKEWRQSVFKRDGFTCIKCGYRSVKRKDIVADHIKPFSLYKKLRLDVSNGRTLCVPCDKKYGWNNFKENNPSIRLNP